MDIILKFEQRVAEINDRLVLLTKEYHDLLDRLDEIPGIDKKSAQSIVSEVGVTLDEFKTMAALVSWTGLYEYPQNFMGRSVKRSRFLDEAFEQ